MTTDDTRRSDGQELSEEERDRLDRIVHVMPYGSDEVRLNALVAAVERILAARGGNTDNGLCHDCGHTHTPDGCTGDPTPSDRWAGVSPSVCDCDRAAALDAAPAPTDNQSESCTCGSPDIYSLNSAEVVVHHADRPCEVVPADTFDYCDRGVCNAEKGHGDTCNKASGWGGR